MWPGNGVISGPETIYVSLRGSRDRNAPTVGAIRDSSSYVEYLALVVGACHIERENHAPVNTIFDGHRFGVLDGRCLRRVVILDALPVCCYPIMTALIGNLKKMATIRSSSEDHCAQSEVQRVIRFVGNR